MEDTKPPPTKRQKPPPPPSVPEGWDRCHAYMDRKARYCRQEVLPSLATLGYFYCGNHRHLCPSAEGIRSSERLRRIPCPVDPTHHIYEHMLEKHIPKCPKTVELESLMLKSYYCHNCNCGGHGSDSKSIDHERKLKSDDAVQEDQALAVRVALAVLQTYHRLFLKKEDRKGPDVAPEPEIDVKQLTENDIFKAIPMFDLSEMECNSGFSDIFHCDLRIKWGGWRQMYQQASLIGNLRRVGVIEDVSRRYMPATSKERRARENSPNFSRSIIEMGAGRGMTGLMLAGVSGRNEKARTHLTMIERGASRSRADKSLRRIQQNPNSFSSSYPYLNLSSVQYDRIQCDISHIDMKCVLESIPYCTTDLLLQQQEVSSPTRRDVIVLAKHLCGVGTDLALKSLEPIKGEITACIMATCCHGICCWKDYVGRDFLMEAMLFDESLLSSFGETEFDLLRRWTSGTVRDPRDTDEHHSASTKKCTIDPVDVSNVTKIAEALNLQCGPRGFGRACQRLIDYGRCEYLRQVLFGDTEKGNCSVELIHYVKESDTPQNAALLAYRRDISKCGKS